MRKKVNLGVRKLASDELESTVYDLITAFENLPEVLKNLESALEVAEKYKK